MKEETVLNDIFKSSFDIFKENYVVLILGALVAIVGSFLIVTCPPLIFGMYYMCIQLTKGKKVEVSDVLKGFEYFWRSWGIVLLTALIVLVGLVLLVIPGVFLMIVLQFVIAVAIIEDKGVVDSIKRSYSIGKQHFALALVLFILVGVITSLGAYTKIGTLITMPFHFLVLCVAFEKLSGKRKK